MADQVRVFVSHHHSPEEDKFTSRLVADLEAAGADVWVDDQRITSDDFIKKINEGLAGRQWLVLVMTPDALHSEWVQAEVNAALHQVRKKRMLGVVPIVAKPCDDEDIPPLLDALHRYDATRSYELARDGLLRALRMSAPTIPSISQAALSSGPVAPPTPHYPLPEVHARLASLGFQGVNVNGMPAIVPPLITIPAGPFLMGSDKACDKVAQDNELPQHRVEVTTFQIAKYPVTVAEFALAIRAAQGMTKPPEFAGITWQIQLRSPDHPVVCVSWNHAMAYVAWLISATGQRGWRLPTEAEWEKAARWDAQQSVSRIYPWGDNFDKDRCNTRESGIRMTTPVGSYPASDTRRSGASPFGVEDMAGGVWEWTNSIFKPYPYVDSDSREERTALGARTLRGGPWYDDARNARSAVRAHNGPNIINHLRGFRLAFSPGS